MSLYGLQAGSKNNIQLSLDQYR
jgi:serine/threonine protein kinase